MTHHLPMPYSTQVMIPLSTFPAHDQPAHGAEHTVIVTYASEDRGRSAHGKIIGLGRQLGRLLKLSTAMIFHFWSSSA